MLKVLYVEPNAEKFRAFKYMLRDLFKESRGMSLVDQARSLRELWIALDREDYDVVIADHASSEAKVAGESTLVKRLLSRDAAPALLVTEAPERLMLDHMRLGWVEQRKLTYLRAGSLNAERIREAFQQIFEREMNVLVIEDEPDDYELISTQLARDGSRCYQAHWVTTVPDARELIEADPDRFDAFIVDYRLPQEDGLSLVRKLLDMGVNKPILLVTGESELSIDPDAARLLNCGQMKFLNKHHLDAMQIGSALQQ